MFKKLPFILMIIIIAAIVLNPIIPTTTKQIIYACSITTKSVVLFLLPFIIFGLLFKTFAKLAGNALSIVCLIFGGLCVSNFINTFLTHYLGSLFYFFDFHVGDSIVTTYQLTPYFNIELPTIIKNEYALFGGMLIGLLSTFFMSKNFINNCIRIVDTIVQKLFSFISVLIPFFITGFVIKCASEGSLTTLMKSYSLVFVIFITYATVYTFLYYVVISQGRLKQCIITMKNMFPAFLTAVSTISSALTMPVTIMCAEKNAKNKELVGSVVSATVNIHLLGDCLGIPLLAYALLKHFNMPEPTLEAYFIFTVFFVIAKFSVAAVPAGGIIVMTPILEKYLGFTPDMSSLIIAIYVIFDPVITGFNVMGNGAFAKLIDTLYNRVTAHKRFS
ncbi:MAG: dicarboxylate/amino acid:cation symporter [Alphaproteobacteria bacterium]|nr:dicarboxylate/amino acid:cation symporter [Alphaproteobacteria bacterium]